MMESGRDAERVGRRRQTVLVILIRRIQFAGGKLRLLTTAADSDSDGPALLLTTKGERANVLNMYLICRALRVFFGAAFRHARARDPIMCAPELGGRGRGRLAMASSVFRGSLRPSRNLRM